MRFNKSILSLSAVLLSAVGAMAQTGAATGTPFGSGADSIRCRQNLSIFNSYAKAGNYAEAYESWLTAYKECPASSKNIYIHGANILKFKINNEKDPAKREALIKDLMAMYDARIKYFGDDPKKGRDAIVLDKVNDFIAVYGEKADYTKVYGWTKEIVDEYKEQSPGLVLYWFLASSRETARGDDDAKKERYLNDYLMASDYLDKQLEAQTDSTLRANLETNIAQLDESFARSGLATCELLNKIYTLDKLEARKDDKMYLATTIKLFQNAVEVDDEGNAKNECPSTVPDKASEYLFHLEPSAKAAMGLAGKYVREKDYSQAVKFLDEAIKLSTNNHDKIKCYELMWSIADRTGNGSLSSRAQSGILAINPNNGRILIRQALALGSRANSIFPGDPILARCVYFAVIARLRAIPAKDPSVAGQVERLIASCRAKLPSKESIFMHPQLSSGTLNIPGYGVVSVR